MNLKAKMIVDTIRWSLERKGIPVYIEHKGDSDAGAIFVKHDKGTGLYDVYHRVNDYNEGKKIKFLTDFSHKYFSPSKMYASARPSKSRATLWLKLTILPVYRYSIMRR